MSSPGRSGGREVVEGQKNGLYVYDRDAVPRDEKGWPVYAVRLDDDRPVCGSPRSRGRGFCESPFRHHNGRCNKHGGSSPRGAASGTFKTGKYSRYMPPPNLNQNYLRGLESPELTHHRDSLALTDALIADALESYEDGATAELWKRVETLYAKTAAANRAGNPRKTREFFEELGQTIERGSRQGGRQQEIMRLLESRRRHAESETRRRSSEERTFSFEEARTFYSAMGAAARKHFGHDEERLSAFVNEISAIARESGVNVET